MTELDPTTYSLSEEFNDLPEAIKTWLASDHCTIYISEINKKLGLKGERRSIIPSLVLRLVTKDLEPQNFIPELSEELNIGAPIAKTLTEEIEAKILHPIELGLRRDAGVDIKLIYLETGQAAPTAIAVPVPIPAAPLAEAKIERPFTPPIIRPITPPVAPKPAFTAEEKPAIAPRVIYHERSLENTPAPIPPRVPATAPISQPEIKQTSARVVHYSNLTSPLKSQNEDQNDNFFDSYIVDLRKI